MLPTHIYCFNFTKSPTCGLFYDPAIISHYLHTVPHLQSKRTQISPKTWMITIQYIHKVYYTRNTSLSLRIFSTKIKTTDEVNEMSVYFI